MEDSIMYAKKYLEDLLSFFGLNIDVYASREEDVIELSVPSTHMNGFLIGQHGDTMRALQYMVSTALKNNDFEYCRVNVDVADYKKGRLDRLAAAATQWIDKVKQTGKELHLEPMNAAERRIVHKVADEYGLTTESMGFGRDRHVVIKPGSFANAPEEDEDLSDSNEESDKDLPQNDEIVIAKEKSPKKAAKAKKATTETKEKVAKKKPTVKPKKAK